MPSASRASIDGMTRPSGERRGTLPFQRPSIAPRMAALPGSLPRMICRPANLLRSRWTPCVTTSSWVCWVPTPQRIGVLRSGAAAMAASTGRHCSSLRRPQLRTVSLSARSPAARTAVPVPGRHREDESTVSYVYRSGDDGLTWTTFEVLRNDQQPGDFLADLIPHPARGDRLFITTYAGDVLISEDAGQNWRSVVQRQAGIEAGVTPPQLAFRPDRPDVALLVRGQNTPGAGALTVARSSDGGVTWRSVAASGLPLQGAPRALAALRGGIYLLNTSAGTFRSADDGVTWQPLEGALSSGGVAEFLALPGATAQSAAAEPTVLAATGHGIYVSRDGGAVWEPLGTGLPFNSKIAGLLTHSASPGMVFAVSDNASLAERCPTAADLAEPGWRAALGVRRCGAARRAGHGLDHRPQRSKRPLCRIIGAGFSQQRRRAELAGSAPGVQRPQSDRGCGL